MENLTLQNFAQKIFQEQQLCLVLFAKESCPLCQEVHPLLEEIEEEYKDRPFLFYLVDTLAEEALFLDMHLQGVPTVLFYQNGKEYQKFSGLRDYEEYTFLIDRMIEGK